MFQYLGLIRNLGHNMIKVLKEYANSDVQMGQLSRYLIRISLLACRLFDIVKYID